MKMNLRRIAAWILTALLIVSCLPIQAIGQGREEYSAPVSFGNELDDGTDETKTLTFSWDDAYDSYVYDTTQFNTLATKPYTLVVPVESTVEEAGLSMPSIEIRNHSENDDETKYLSIYNWRNTSASNEQFTKNSTIWGDTEYTLVLELFAEDDTQVNFNFICGLDDDRHTVAYSSPTIKVGGSLTESQIPTSAAISSYCSVVGSKEDYRFAGSWTIDKAGIPLTPDVVFSDEHIAAWKYEYSDGVLIDVRAEWEVRVTYTYTDENEESQTGEIWVKRGDTLGDSLPEGYTWTTSDGNAVNESTVVSAPLTLTGTGAEMFTVTFTAGEHGSLGEDVTEIEQLVISGEAIGEDTLNTIQLTADDGYEFTGWMTADGTPVTAETVVSEDMTVIAQYRAIGVAKVTLSNVQLSNLSQEAQAAIAAITVGMKVSEISIPGFVKGEYVTYADGTTSATPFDHWEWTDTTPQTISLLDRLVPHAIAEDDLVTEQGNLTAVFETVEEDTKLEVTKVTQSAASRYERPTFSIPVYYYLVENNSNVVIKSDTFDLTAGNTDPWWGYNTSEKKFGAEEADVGGIVGAGYAFDGVCVSSGSASITEVNNTVSFTTTASISGDYGNFTYTTKITGIKAGEAIYVKVKTVKPSAVFNLNGGTSTTTINTIEGTSGDPFTFPSGDNLSKSGYIFKGWSTTSDGSGTIYPAGSIGTLTAGEVTYYAVWAKVYTITFVENKAPERSFSITVEENSGLSFPDVSSEWLEDGRVFSGWSKDSSGQTPSGENGVFSAHNQWSTIQNGNVVAINVTADQTFYAIWVDEVTSGTVSAFFHIYYKNRDVIANAEIPYEPATYTPSGYTSYHGMSGTIKNAVGINNNLAAVASNIASPPSTAAILNRLKTDINAYDNMTLEEFEANYDVVWYVIKKQCWSDSLNRYQDWHVDGVIKEKASYWVHYHANGGTNLPADHSEKANNEVDVRFEPTPTRLGYTFLGWAEDSTATTPTYTQSGTKTFTMPAEDVDLYAIWRPNTDTAYTVQYYYSDQKGNYSETPDSVTTRYGTTKSIVYVTDADKVPQKYGYVLDDDTTRKVYYGEVLADGSLVLKVYFKYSVTSVWVEKRVSGNMADPNKDYSFTAVVKVNGTKVVPPTKSGYSVAADGTITFTLKGTTGNNSITLLEIPTNALVTVAEADYSSEGYTTSYYLGDENMSGSSVELDVANSQFAVTFVNAKSATIDTGITLDVLPYMLLLGGALAMLAVLLVRRRRES